MKRYLVPFVAFLLGSTLITGVYFDIPGNNISNPRALPLDEFVTKKENGIFPCSCRHSNDLPHSE